MVGRRGLWWLERGRGLGVDGSLKKQKYVSDLRLWPDDNLGGVARDPMVLLPITRWRQASHLSS